MLGPRRARAYRTVFGLAAAYNLAFALWIIVRPGSIFTLFGMDEPQHTAFWRLLGLPIAAFGVAYGYAAFRPERARPVVALGLLAKIVPPLAWLGAVSYGAWPVSTLPLILLNDIIWWLPFSLFLRQTGGGPRGLSTEGDVT